MTENLILASGSKIRATLLANAGLSFDIIPAHIDEEAIKDEYLARAHSPKSVALKLAQEKAIHISLRHDGLVIGADSVVEIERDLISKSDTFDQAKALLKRFSGQTHYLHSAVALAQGGQVIWSHAGTAELSVRRLNDAFVDDYLKSAGEEVLKSVGCYQLEGLGLQLFDDIRGDYFTILGLPMLPLLNQLRHLEVIAS